MSKCNFITLRMYPVLLLYMNRLKLVPLWLKKSSIFFRQAVKWGCFRKTGITKELLWVALVSPYWYWSYIIHPLQVTQDLPKVAQTPIYLMLIKLDGIKTVGEWVMTRILFDTSDIAGWWTLPRPQERLRRINRIKEGCHRARNWSKMFLSWVNPHLWIKSWEILKTAFSWNVGQRMGHTYQIRFSLRKLVTGQGF